MTPGLRDYWFFLKAGLNPADYPELRLVETEELREQIVDRFYESQKDKTSWILFWLGIFVASLIFAGPIMDYYPRNLLPFWLTMPLVYLGVSAFGTVTLRIWGRKTLPTFIRKELRRYGYLVCLHCGYNLQGQVDLRCPECGEPFDTKDLGERGEIETEPPPRKRSKLEPWKNVLFWTVFLGVVTSPSIRSVWVFVVLIVVFLIWDMLPVILAIKNMYTGQPEPKREPPQRPRIEQGKGADDPRIGSAG